MISSKIRRRIRHFELRTNRLRGETFASCSPEASPQHRRIPRTVPHCYDSHLRLRFVDCKVNGVRPAEHTRFTAVWTGFEKSEWLNGNRVHHLVHIKGKSHAASRALRLIRCDRFLKFNLGFRVVEKPEAHSLHFRSVSSRSCSQGVPRPGFLSAASARRSSSATCSGVSSSSTPPNSMRIFSASSCCSAGGSRRICSRISAALMSPIYKSLGLRASEVLKPVDGPAMILREILNKLRQIEMRCRVCISSESEHLEKFSETIMRNLIEVFSIPST